MKKNIILLLLLFLHCGSDRIKTNNGDYVILLHGLARYAGSMSTMEDYLHKKGFHVINMDYPSTKYKIEILSEKYLHNLIIKHCTDPSKKIHFVTHSLGGIIVRYYLKNHEIKNLGRIVMLSPPNKGSEMADFFKDNLIVSWILGPSLLQLTTDKGSLPNTLGDVDYETGVIMGNKSINFLSSIIIPGENDGTVSLESARVRGMKELIVVQRSHTFIMNADEVIEAAYNFLLLGRFTK